MISRDLRFDKATIGYPLRAFGGRFSEVLRSVSFEIGPGEVGIVCGPNGVGKTSLLRAAAGFVEPVSGTILLAGAHPACRSIAYLPQRESTSPWRRSIDEARLLAMPMGETRFHATRMVLEITKTLGFSADLRKRCHALSGGQRQQIAITRTLLIASEVDLVMLDEPTNFLDASVREMLLAALPKLLSDLACPVLLATHDAALIAAIGGRIIRVSEECTLVK